MTDNLDELTRLARRTFRDTLDMRVVVQAILHATNGVTATHDPDEDVWRFTLGTNPVNRLIVGPGVVFMDVDRNARIVGIEVH